MERRTPGVPSTQIVPRDEQGEQPGPGAGHGTRYRHDQSHPVYNSTREDDICPPETKYLKRRRISFTSLDSKTWGALAKYLHTDQSGFIVGGRTAAHIRTGKMYRNQDPEYLCFPNAEGAFTKEPESTEAPFICGFALCEDPLASVPVNGISTASPREETASASRLCSVLQPWTCW